MAICDMEQNPPDRDLLIEEWSDSHDTTVLQLDGGFEAAVVGGVETWDRTGGRHAVLVYSQQRVVEILMSQGVSNETDAWDYAYFNIFCAYMGLGTPIYVDEFRPVVTPSREPND